LYLNNGPVKREAGYLWNVREDTTAELPSTTSVPTPAPTPNNATIHIGFHDIFIEGEYLTVRSK
jgi:hypothetical protein